jgi:YidC/Oxa1 family membrane protein insertase
MWDAIIITPFVNVLLLIYTLVHNFGIAIILFTILIRLITYPLFTQQMKSATAMQDLQKDKRWIEMQAKLKDDKEKLAQEQMKLYRELGINPFGSCLPTIIQFPIIIGLYQSIIRTLASTPLDLLTLVRHIYPGLIKVASTIPLNNRFLWMDLGQPERLYVLGFGIPVLAVVVVATTYLQSKLMTPPPSSPNDQSAQISKAMNLYMPFLMGWLAYSLSSGLSLYFVASNVVGIAQYMAMGRANWRNIIPSFSFGGSKPAQSDVKKLSSSSSVKKSGNKISRQK